MDGLGDGSGVEPLDRFEISGGLAGRQAANGAIGEKDTVPAAFKTVRGEGKVAREVAGPAVKISRPAPDSLAGHGELGTDEKAIVSGAWRAK